MSQGSSNKSPGFRRKSALCAGLILAQLFLIAILILGGALKLASMNAMVRKIAEEDSNPLLMINLPWFVLVGVFFLTCLNAYILRTYFKDVIAQEWPDDVEDQGWIVN